MIKSEIKITDLQSLLLNKNDAQIAEAIETLRKELPFEGAISLLTSFYDSSVNQELRKNIGEFMNDLKDQEAVHEIIREIKKGWKEETVSMLVSSCWQSGLDYSAYCTDLAEIFITSDYITAFECLTVIDESINQLSGDIKKDLIKLINESPVTQTPEKQGLTSELLSLLKS